MNKIETGFIIAGIICILCAASNDDYYIHSGSQYPLTNLVLWICAGIMSIIIGYGMRFYLNRGK